MSTQKSGKGAGGEHERRVAKAKREVATECGANGGVGDSGIGVLSHLVKAEVILRQVY